MKKVGLVSVRNHNYGSILQAFAFQKVLDEMGIDNEILYYEKKSHLNQLLRIFNKPLLRAKIKDIYKKLYGKYINKNVGNILSNRDYTFQDFIKKNLRFSKHYIGRNALEEGAENYKAFVLGSDQVWNPMNLGSNFYTLTFIPDSKLKVSYASSFGVSKIPASQIKKTKAYLNRIDFISVRENTGSKIIKELTGKDVPVVVDPTMLFDSSDWNKLISDERLVNGDYIFCYFVGANQAHRNAAKKLSEKTGCKIVLIPHVDEIAKADMELTNKDYSHTGPAEFVNLIRHAKFVCTDSFHATVFSIHYRRSFFVFDRFASTNKSSMNSRLASILEKIGLESRLVSSRGDIINWYYETIDYSGVGKKLELFRTESKEYLNKMAELLKAE